MKCGKDFELFVNNGPDKYCEKKDLIRDKKYPLETEIASLIDQLMNAKMRKTYVINNIKNK